MLCFELGKKVVMGEAFYSHSQRRTKAREIMGRGGERMGIDRIE